MSPITNIDREIDNLKESISEVFSVTKRQLKHNISRGHSRSISSDIEDNIALFISNILTEDYKIFLDPSIRVDSKNNRPDLLIIDENNHVVSMIEIKSNMGYCRVANGEIETIIANHNKFIEEGILFCKFSDAEEQVVNYNESVKLFLISLTSDNCSERNHINNKSYAEEQNVGYYNLFKGWYGELENNEVGSFVNKLHETINWSQRN